MLRPFAALLCLSASAMAQELPLSAEEFDAYSQGKTLTYSAEGMSFGVEQYLPGRRVRWAFIGEDCLEGQWYPRGDLICFQYEEQPGEECWQFFLRNGRLTALARDPGDPDTLYETHQNPEPLFCPGPEIGV